MAIITVTESGVVTVGNGDTVIIDIPGGGDVTLVADPTSNVQTFRVEFVDDSQADKLTILLPTFTSDDLHIDIKDYDPTDQISLVGASNAFVEPNNVDEYQFSYVGADGQTYEGFVRAKDKGERDFTQSPSPIIICFSAETELRSALGWKRADQIKPWDCLFTLDAGYQPVRWVGRHRIDADMLAAHPDLAPIVVEPGALGHKTPRRRMRLSPQHRILVRGWRLQMMFGVDEALVPVKALVDGVRIYPDAHATEVSYHHVLLDRHAVLNAEGCFAESLLMAQGTRDAMQDGLSGHIAAEIADTALRGLSTVAARPFLSVAEGRAWAAEMRADARAAGGLAQPLARAS